MRAYEILVENITVLLEDRIEYIAGAMKDRLEQAAKKDNAILRTPNRDFDSLKIVQTLKTMDPDPVGKNLQFLANRYADGQFSLEDGYHIKAALDLFAKNKAKLPIKDLNAVKSIEQLYQLVQQFETQPQDQQLSGREQERLVKSEAEKLIDSPNFKVIIPKTEAASCLYGKGTKWCTSGENDNYFDSYSKKGPLYIIITNLNGKPRKFQLHYEENEFMDELNQPIKKADIAELSKLPEYKQFLEYLIRKHYGKYLTL